MVEHRSETLDIRGCRVEMLRGGAGPRLLFLHGAGGAADWAPYMDRLAERFELMVPSHPGFGRSDTPDWLDGMSDLAFFYLDLLDALDPGSLHVVGTSLGGWLACEIAVRDIRRFRSLALAAPVGISVPGAPVADIFLWKPEERARNTFHDQDLAARQLAAMRAAGAADIALKNLFTTAKLSWSPRFCNPDLAKWLHRITVPTLFVWGADDRIVPPAYGDAFRRLIPGARLRLIQACGHQPHVEKTDEFLDAVSANIEGDGT